MRFFVYNAQKEPAEAGSKRIFKGVINLRCLP